MTSAELDRLADTGRLKREQPDQTEFDGLVRLGEAKYRDAQYASLSLESRFDLAYGAAHSYSLAALRWCGYRSEARYVVFQSLEHTVAVPRDIWRVLDKAHGERNRTDYGGDFQVSEGLLRDVLAATAVVRRRVLALGPVPI